MQCRHQPCECRVEEQAQQDGYCSPSCRQNDMAGNSNCECGHGDCRQ